MLLRPELIHRKATDIVRGCGTRDTVRIAKELGIYVHFIDGLNELLGMYTYRHMQMMLELLSLLMSRYTVGVQEAAKAFHKKSNRNRQRKDVHYEVQTVPFPP